MVTRAGDQVMIDQHFEILEEQWTTLMMLSDNTL